MSLVALKRNNKQYSYRPGNLFLTLAGIGLAAIIILSITDIWGKTLWIWITIACLYVISLISLKKSKKEYTYIPGNLFLTFVGIGIAIIVILSIIELFSN